MVAYVAGDAEINGPCRKLSIAFLEGLSVPTGALCTCSSARIPSVSFYGSPPPPQTRDFLNGLFMAAPHDKDAMTSITPYIFGS